MHKTYYFEELGSTNSTAKEYAEGGALHGTAVWAAKQTNGRGRLGKDWHSVDGAGLYCSIILRPAVPVDQLAKVTLVTGVAVGEVLEELTGKKVQLKWPNDVYFSGLKCAGILAESSLLNSGDSTPYVVVGIGVNVNQSRTDFPAELKGNVTTLFEESGRKFILEELLESLRDRLLLEVNRFETQGFEPLLRRWKQMDFLFGKEMECVDVTGKIIKGVSMGPDTDGNLHVKSADGTVHKVLSGDVRLAGKQNDASK
jgi:BirA family biotin operon repressor/biotin-[acetyl-CoA-carboxylase] ligase